MSSTIFQPTYSEELDAFFSSLGMNDTLDQKYLFDDQYPFYPFGVNTTITNPLDASLFDIQSANVWDTSMPNAFNDIDAFTMPNTNMDDATMHQHLAKVEMAKQAPTERTDFCEDFLTEEQIKLMRSMTLNDPVDTYGYATLHPSELLPFSTFRYLDATPNLPPIAPSEHSSCSSSSIEPANHPPAKRLRSPSPRAAKEASGLGSRPKIRKTASFHNGSSSSRTLRRSRGIVKSKSVPHMSSRTTSAPQGMQVEKSLSSSSFQEFSFVNYTMDDGDELLAAVAPSGTLKTRARREQEAREEQRRLEEAALAAIRKAGGDPRDLQLFLR